MSPIPLIICGQHEPVVRAAAKMMLPEYEYIHACTTVEEANNDIPLLLNGSVPPNFESNWGSQNYAKPPVAVVLGGGFTDADFKAITVAHAGKSSVPWLRLDTTIPAPPLGPSYGVHVAGRLKKCLNSLQAEGKFGQDGVYLF